MPARLGSGENSLPGSQMAASLLYPHLAGREREGEEKGESGEMEGRGEEREGKAEGERGGKGKKEERALDCSPSYKN